MVPCNLKRVDKPFICNIACRNKEIGFTVSAPKQKYKIYRERGGGRLWNKKNWRLERKEMADAPKRSLPPEAARRGFLLGMSTTAMAVTAVVVAGVLAYYALYVKTKPEVYPRRVADPPPAARVDPDVTRPRKYPDRRPSS